MIEAQNLQIGDKIDLENDPYADTDATNHATRMSFEFELCEVIDSVEFDSKHCVIVHTSCGSFGFPPHHAFTAE